MEIRSPRSPAERGPRRKVTASCRVSFSASVGPLRSAGIRALRGYQWVRIAPWIKLPSATEWFPVRRAAASFPESFSATSRRARSRRRAAPRRVHQGRMPHPRWALEADAPSQPIGGPPVGGRNRPTGTPEEPDQRPMDLVTKARVEQSLTLAQGTGLRRCRGATDPSTSEGSDGSLSNCEDVRRPIKVRQPDADSVEESTSLSDCEHPMKTVAD